MAEKEPIVVYDSKEHWVVYPSDNAYLMCARIKPNSEGIRHVTQEMVEALKGWWYTKAVEKVEKALDGLDIPWEELRVTGEEIESGNLFALAKKLALISHNIIKVNDFLTLVAARHSAAKEALEQASNQRLARDDKYGGDEGARRPAIAVRLAAMIHQEKPLRDAKIEVIEAGAFLKAMEFTKDSLDVAWRTVSRIVSARLAEPND